MYESTLQLSSSRYTALWLSYYNDQYVVELQRFANCFTTPHSETWLGNSKAFKMIPLASPDVYVMLLIRPEWRS